MANASTLLTTLQANFAPGRKGGYSQIFQRRLTFDTLATPLTVASGVANKNIILLGYSYAETAAHQLSWLSDVNLIVQYDMPANSSIFRGITACEGSEIIARTGDSLVAQVDTALIPSMVVYLAYLDGGFYYT